MKKHLLFIVGIIVGTILIWHKVLGQSLMGEGYYYFIHGFGYGPLLGMLQEIFVSYDAGAKLLFDFFRIVFKDNIFLYQLFLLLSVVFINIFFYLFVFALSEAWIIAFVAGILFSVNFVGFEMFALGNYQWFAQRALSFVFLFPSITFLTLFLKERSHKYLLYTLSLILYTLSFILFHFSLFFSPYFFCIFAVFFFKNKPSIRRFIRSIFLALPFLIVPFIILRSGNDPVTKISLLTFFQHYGRDMIPAFMQQTSILTIPESILVYFSKLWKLSHGAAAIKLFYPTIIFYLLTLYWLYKRKSKFFLLSLLSFVYFPVVFFMNLYTRWEMTVNLGSGSRYLYVPTAAFAIYWGIVLATLFQKKKIVIVIILGIWSIMQIQSISKTFAIDDDKHLAARKSLQYVKYLAPKLQSDSIVIVPSVLSYYGSNFAQVFYGKEHTKFAPMFSNWANELPRAFDPKKDFILDYDVNNQVVLDRTADYQSIIPSKAQ